MHKKTKKVFMVAVYIFAVFGLVSLLSLMGLAIYKKVNVRLVVTDQPDFDVELLSVNEYSRPAIPTEEIHNLVVHYTANPGTSAQQNRDYFEGLAQSGETYASSHFIVGLEGEIIQCIPTSEMCYAANDRNVDTVSIEVCHPDESGKYTDATYASLVELCAFLCGKFELEPEDIIRHFDVNGKNCPKYYVENEEAWDTFHADVAAYIKEHGKRVKSDAK